MTSSVFQPEPYAAAKKSENKANCIHMRICLLASFSSFTNMRKFKIHVLHIEKKEVIGVFEKLRRNFVRSFQIYFS